MLNKITAAVMALTVSVSFTGSLVGYTDEAETTEPVTVQKKLSFDPNNIIREEIPNELFGYNVERMSYSSMTGGSSVVARGAKFLANEDLSANLSAKKDLEGYPFVHARFGGGSFNSLRWKDELGDLTQHKIVLSSQNRYTGYARGLEGSNMVRLQNGYDFNTIKNDASIVDMLNWWKVFSDDHYSLTCTLNIITDTLENQIDLVEFLTSDGSINYNGGENWGKIRRESYDIDKVNMYAWELGNEVDLSTTTIDEFIDAIKKFVPAIRTVDKKTPIAVAIATSDTGSVGVEWQRKLLMECGDMIDYIVIHKYFGFNSVTAVAESTVRKVIDDIEKFGDPNRHKIIFTEYNTSWISNRSDWVKNASISSAVTIADFMIRMLEYPQLIEADFHALASGGGNCETLTSVQGTSVGELGYLSDSGPWWAYYVDTDKKVKPTASLDILKVFYENCMDSKLIQVNLDDFKLGFGAMSTAAAALNKNGEVCIFLTNFEREIPMQINLQNSGYYLKEDVKIYGVNGMYSVNFRDKKEVNIDRKSYKDKEELSEYTLAPMSFAMIKLASIN